jgi:hypothetical protein
MHFHVGAVGGSGAWTELTNAKDVTLNLEAGEADVTTRGNNGWRATVPTLKEASVEWEMVWNTADAGFTRQKRVPFTWRRNSAISAAEAKCAYLVGPSGHAAGV